MKSKFRILLVALSASALVLTAGLVRGDDDDGERGSRLWGKLSSDVRPVDSAAYKAECSSCHFAYQPGLLPARSWERLMDNLHSHFGDNAELDPATREQIKAYLLANAADTAQTRRSAAFANSVAKNDAPLRITETPYFLRKHDEIPQRVVLHNKQVGSFSNCIACHSRADQGSYNEHEVRIPGVGRWED